MVDIEDEWEVFPCDMDGVAAWIVYNEGFARANRKEIPTHLLRISVDLANPREDGMPQGEEFEKLNSLEDHLIQELESQQGHYVGRITHASKRHWFNYVPIGREQVSALLESLRRASNYEPDGYLTDDPEHEGYWKSLYPSDESKQLIADTKVIESLRGHGDSLTRSRQVRHWAQFGTQQDAAKFSDWLTNRGYRVEDATSPDTENPQWQVQFTHELVPSLQEVTRHTQELNREAKNMGGDYDGWETSVERE